MLQTNLFEEPSASPDGPFIASDVSHEIARLRTSRAYAQEGHTGRTLTKYSGLRVVLEVMTAGVRLPFHETAEQLTLQVILGQLRVRMPFGEHHDVPEGSFAAVGTGRVLALESLEDCAFLLTLGWPPAAPPEDGEDVEGAGI